MISRLLSAFRYARVRVEAMVDGESAIALHDNPQQTFHRALGYHLHTPGCPGVRRGQPCVPGCAWQRLHYPYAIAGMPSNLYNPNNRHAVPPAAFTASLLDVSPGAQYFPGARFEMEIGVCGDRIELLPDLLYAVMALGSIGFGTEQQRGEYTVTRVFGLTPRGEEVISTDATRTMARPYEFHWDDFEKATHWLPTDLVNIVMLSPLDNRTYTAPTCATMIRLIHARLRALLLTYGLPQRTRDDDGALTAWLQVQLAQSASIKLVDHFALQSVQSKYHHYGGISTFRGIVGGFRFAGPILPLLPLFLAGELLRVGKHTAFGYGRYQLVSTSVYHWLNDASSTINDT